jgi:ribosome-binding protein aMBF1 (putative translation factor)
MVFWHRNHQVHKVYSIDMPRVSKISKSPPAAVEEILNRLGRNIRIARLRRKLSREELAKRIGLSRYVLADVENGKPTTAVAAYVGALWALGLIQEMREIADPDRDEEGKILERSRSPKTAPKRRTADDDF